MNTGDKVEVQHAGTPIFEGEITGFTATGNVEIQSIGYARKLTLGAPSGWFSGNAEDGWILDLPPGS